MKRASYIHKQSQVIRKWKLFDADGIVLGKLATKIAMALIGKDKKTYTPNLDNGDYAVVINAAKVIVTGQKESKKFYITHSGIPGGLRKRNLAELRRDNPTEIIVRAVNNMLPKNKLRADRLVRLKVFADDQHPYQEQISDESKG